MKHLFTIISLLFLLTPLLHATEDTPFKVGDVNFTCPKYWSLKEPIRKRLFHIIHNNDIATINITQRLFSKPITANALQEKRSITHYDGWIKLLSRPGSQKENNQSNAAESHVSVYVRQFLNNNLKLNEHLIAEYYYIKNSHYYIVTVETTKHHWKQIQPDLKAFLENFWLGKKKEKKHQISEDISEKNWTFPGNINNTQYIDAYPNLQRKLSLEWELNYPVTTSTDSIPALTKNDMLFFIKNNNLHKTDIKTGQIKWQYPLQNTQKKPFLAIHSNLIFTLNSNNQLLALSASTGEKIYSIPLDNLQSRPLFSQQLCYINDNGTLKTIAIATGQLLWEKDLLLSPVSTPLLANETLLLQKKSHEIIAINKHSGNLIWTTKAFTLVQKPSCNNDHLFLPIKDSTGAEKLIALNTKTGAIAWGFNKAILNFTFTQEIATNHSTAIITGSVIDVTINKRVPVLFGINTKTGQLEWQKTLANPIYRPLLTNTTLFALEFPSNHLLILDTLTGEQIPIHKNSPLPQTSNSLMLYKKHLIHFIIQNDMITIKCFS